MTFEYIMLLAVVFMLGVKSFISAPTSAFMKDGGARLGARVEKHLVTGHGFAKNEGINWTAPE